MNKVFLTLVLALTFVSTYASYADIGHAYHDYYGHYRKYQDRQIVCDSAIADVNAAISQLFFDVKMQNNQWIIYADLDSLDESSYYLIRTCPLQTLELANLQQDVSQTPSQACSQIINIIGSILAHDGAHDFRAGYERGVELSVTALDAGKNLGNECNIVLRQAQQGGIQQGETSNGGAESDNNEDELSLIEESDGLEEAEINFDARILASNAADNQSDDSDDSDKEDSDDNSDDKSDNDNEDQNDSSDDDSDDSSDEDSDTEDDNSNGSFSWNGSQGLRVKFSKTKDGHKDDYTISYDPKNGGFSMKKSESDDEDEDEDANEENEEEGNTEEANNEEEDNNEESQDLSSLITGLYINDGQGGNYNNNYDNNHNYNGDHNDIITFLYYL